MAFPHARDAELARIRVLVRAVRAGRGDALVLVGGPGSGRTTLLDAARAIATGVHVLRVVGVQSEQDEPSDRLRGLTDLAADHPVLCLVDDAQWLGAASLTALGRTARRCEGSGLGLLFAVPGPGWAELSGVEQLVLPAAPDAVPADLPMAVRAALIETTAGAPGHLVALAASLTPAQRAGHSPVPDLLPPAHRASLAALLTGLGPAARTVAILCACEPLPLDAVDRAGLDRAAVAECVRSGLVTVHGDHVRCPSPVIAATLLADVPGSERAAAHATLAAVFDNDPRATWHRFAEARPPDAIAAESLAEAGRRAHAAGEFPTAVRALTRAADLSPAPATAARLHLAAADAAWSAGRATQAEALLARARAGDPALAGETALRQGEIALRAGHPVVAAHQLALAADQLTTEDRKLQALILAGEARRMAGDLVGYAAIAERVAAAPPGVDPLVARHFAAMAATFAGRHPAAGLALRRAAMAVPAHDTRRALWSCEAAMIVGQVDLAHEHASAAVARARSAGERTLLPLALAALAMTTLVLDRPAAATAVATEGRAAAVAAGQSNSEVEHLTLLALAAVSAGDCATALTWLALAAPGIAERGLGRPGTYAAWARGCVDLAEDRPEEAFGRLRAMATGIGRAHPAIRVLATPQLVEAAVRCGRADQARKALARYDCWAESTGAPTWLAFSRRCHALLEPESAAEHFEAAIRCHLAAGSTLELGRTRLLYARHLRRDRQARAARDQLHDALRLFDGAPHWAERARAELRAAGDVGTVRPARGEGLTPQQELIARLVAQGRTNREIAERLVISHRTVDHHLRNVFLRLGVRSRVELAAAYAREAG